MKIVSLIPSATEIISALNLYDNLVGVSHECDYPKKALKLPKLTTSRIKTKQVSLKIDYDIREILEQSLSVYEVKSNLLKKLDPDVIITQSQCSVCAVSLKDVEKCLGDFIDKYYARYWAGVLACYENVSIYGYTAHNENSDIGKILLEITKKFGFDRFAVRWSNNVNSKLNTANSTDFKPRIIGAKNVKLNSITCLEQVNKVKNCASCGLCWNSKINQINFITH